MAAPESRSGRRGEREWRGAVEEGGTYVVAV